MAPALEPAPPTASAVCPFKASHFGGSRRPQHGFFTFALVEGLIGKADVNKDGVIHLSELDAYACATVRTMTKGQQNPVTGKPAGLRSFALSRK